MKITTLHIKNMVCPRCVVSVKEVFDAANLSIQSIALGEIVLNGEFNAKQKKMVSEMLEERGFELLEDNQSKLISKIKTLLIHSIQYNTQPLHINVSDYLSENLNHEYAYLSRLFSSVEGVTIEKFVLSQKIEKVKELIFYNELTLSEIADQMGYSSVAYLSAQFKKETGMTPTEFKKQKDPGLSSLDSL
jgi:AraC-like DNA-binding protein